MTVGRFAPSPSGTMHLGNVSVALLAWLSAKSRGGEIVLRIEDLDPARSRREYAEAIMDELRWLGLPWDRRAEDQSKRGEAYMAALERLQTYPCYCSRDELRAASAPHASDGRVVYAGTCRNLTEVERNAKQKRPCLRVMVPDRDIAFTDGLQGRFSMSLQREWGDFIVRRADGVAAYQLAVVVDDAANGVTEVVRGRDLLSSTPAQLWLYEALGLKAPAFYHTPMLLAADGRRLSKRDGDCNLGHLREIWPPQKVIGLLAWWLGLIDRWENVSPMELAGSFEWGKVRCEDIRVTRIEN
ncbi:MAG: tRNA glutamyl-Q(34) synthetase GluQRS [bacterium]